MTPLRGCHNRARVAKVIFQTSIYNFFFKKSLYPDHSRGLRVTNLTYSFLDAEVTFLEIRLGEKNNLIALVKFKLKFWGGRDNIAITFFSVKKWDSSPSLVNC